MIRAIGKMLKPLKLKIALLIGRCVILAVDTTTKVQELQIEALKDEVIDNIEHRQTYGFASVPLAGADGIVLAVGASRNNAVMIGVEDTRYRVQGLENGDVAIYDDKEQTVLLTKDGISITAKKLSIKTDADIELKAKNLNVDANNISLGMGGMPLARVGDTIIIDKSLVPDAVGSTGIITSGSKKVTSI